MVLRSGGKTAVAVHGEYERDAILAPLHALVRCLLTSLTRADGALFQGRRTCRLRT